MKGVLAQSQIDALLQDISGGKVEIDNFIKEKSVKEYDFRIPKKFTKEQLRTLIGIHETYARHLSSYLTGTLRTYCKVEFVSIEETRFHEFSNAVPESVLLGVIDMLPYQGDVVMSLSSELAFTVLDKLLGGLGQDSVEERDYTDIELVVLERFYKNIVSYLKDAWTNIVNIDPKFQRFETDNSSNIMHLDEIIVLLVMNVEIKDVNGKIMVCLPFRLLETIGDKLYAKFRFSEMVTKKASTSETEDILLSNLYNSPIEVKAILGDSQIYVNDFLNMEVGDIIKLNQKVGEPVKIKIGSKAWFEASLGVRNKKKAVKIIESAE